MASRYWRIFIEENHGGSYAALQEIEFRTTPGGADATGPGLGVASASSSFDSFSTGAAAFDNNLTDLSKGAWVSSGGVSTFPQWVAWDFGTPVETREVALLPQARSDLVNRAPKTFEIQSSSDGVEWITRNRFANLPTWQVGVWKTFASKMLGTVAGNALLSNGDPATKVVLTLLTAPAAAEYAVPDAAGAWSASVEVGEYLVTAMGPAGYRPLTHLVEVQ